MSQQGLMEVLEKASTDAAFREELKKNPDAALKGYELSAEERAALMSGDASTLESMGVDARITKTSGGWFESQSGPFATDI